MNDINIKDINMNINMNDNFLKILIQKITFKILKQEKFSWKKIKACNIKKVDKLRK